MLFLAFLDNLDPGPGSSRLRSAIEKFSGFNVTPSAWIFEASSSAKELVKELGAGLDATDVLFITEVCGDADGVRILASETLLAELYTQKARASQNIGGAGRETL
jgi:hypothetical protein